MEYNRELQNRSMYIWNFDIGQGQLSGEEKRDSVISGAANTHIQMDKNET